MVDAAAYSSHQYHSGVAVRCATYLGGGLILADYWPTFVAGLRYLLLFFTFVVLFSFPPVVVQADTPNGSNQRVITNDNVNVRNTPAGTLKGSQPEGVFGRTLTAGQPAWLNGELYVWFEVNFDSGTDGWVAYVGLDRVEIPSITGVNPNPVIGSNSSQRFIIYGEQFFPGATVRLYDLTHGDGPYYKTPPSHSGTRIEIDANFTDKPADWTVEVINAETEFSDPYEFRVDSPYPEPHITSVSPTTLYAWDQLQEITVRGDDITSGVYGGGSLRFTDPGGTQYSSASHPDRINEASSSRWRYEINVAGHIGTWSVQVVNVDGQTSNSKTFQVSITPPLEVNGISSRYAVASAPYRPTIQLSGSGFYSLEHIVWTCEQPGGTGRCPDSPYTWRPSDWDGKVSILSDGSGTVSPSLLVAGDMPGRYHWTANFSSSNGSEQIPFKVDLQLPPPSQTLPINGATIPSDTVSLTWQPVPGAQAYSVGLRDETTGQLIEANLVTDTLASFPLIAGHDYVWDVAACFSATDADDGINCADVSRSGNRAFTAVGSAGPAPVISAVEPQSIPAAARLQSITIRGENFPTGDHGHLRFTDPDGATYQSTTYPTRLGRISDTEWNYLINNDGHAGTWLVEVIGVDGQVSNSVSFQVVAPGGLATPVLLGPADGASDVDPLATFTWESVSGADGYWLTVADDPNKLPADTSASACPRCVVSGLTRDLSHRLGDAFDGWGTDLGLMSGRQYYWQIQAMSANAFANSGFSPIRTFSVGAAATETSTVAVDVTNATPLLTIASFPPGIECGETCSADFPVGTRVELVPIWNDDRFSVLWPAECYLTGESCVLNAVNDLSIQATVLTHQGIADEAIERAEGLLDGEGDGKMAIIITHGWQPDSEQPDVSMRALTDFVCNRLSLAKLTSPTADEMSLVCSNDDLDVWYYDWQTPANTGYLSFAPYIDAPTPAKWFLGSVEAWGNAYQQGEDLALKLNDAGYEHLHLIGHSAGSRVLDVAASRLAGQGQSSPTVHLTFLDAYDASAQSIDGKQVSRYGVSDTEVICEPGSTACLLFNAEWAENYVDRRPLFSREDLQIAHLALHALRRSALSHVALEGVGALAESWDKTRLHMPGAFNFEVTPETDGCGGISGAACRHDRPIRSYALTVDPYGSVNADHDDVDPVDYVSGIGFELSAARGARDETIEGHFHSLRNQYPQGSECSLLDYCAGFVAADNLTWKLEAVPLSRAELNSFSGNVSWVLSDDQSVIEAMRIGGVTTVPQTSNGTVSAGESPQSFRANASEFSWVEFEAVTTAPVNSMSFVCSFDEHSDGLLSIMIDGSIVGKLDTRMRGVCEGGEERVEFGVLPEGQYTIGFRLQEDTATALGVEVRDVALKWISADGYFPLVLEAGGEGRGFIRAEPGSMGCEGPCIGNFREGTAVALQAQAAPGSSFIAWSGDPDCHDGEVLMTSARSCTALFDLLDTDHDSVPDVLDNCADIANTDQADGDADGLGDLCEDGLAVVRGIGSIRGSVVPETQVVRVGEAATFEAVESEGFRVVPETWGSCPLGQWTDNLWTTGPISRNCDVRFGFGPENLERPIRRCSASTAGGEADGSSSSSVLTADGSLIAFQSSASNLVSDVDDGGPDANGRDDVFLFERATGEIVRVSLGDDEQEGDANSRYPSISSDGRLVAFQSDAEGLVADDTNGRTDIFVRDVQERTTRRVSIGNGGVQGQRDSDDPSISGNGEVVAFHSTARLESDGSSMGRSQVYVRKLAAGTTELVSVAQNGSAGIGRSRAASLSHDGRYVVFDSEAYLVDGVSNDQQRIYRRDRVSRETVHVSKTYTGGAENGDSRDAAISADGRYVAFESYASNLVPGDTNGEMDVFVRDIVAQETLLVSRALGGGFSDGYSGDPKISPDGRYVVFESNATNLVDSNPQTGGVYRHDLWTGDTVRISTSMTGDEPDGSSSDPAASEDGKLVAFASNATNLVASDLNGQTDIFVWNEDGIAGDADGDTIADSADNCPSVAALDQTDTDGDGLGDACDLDDDDDQTLDVADAFPLDGTEQLDTDLDGRGDHADPDDDNDGVPDQRDTAPRNAGLPVGTIRIQLQPGANLIGYAAGVPPVHQGCADLMTDIGPDAAPRVSRLAPGSGAMERCTPPDAGFDIAAGMGYLVDVDAARELVLYDDRPCVSLDLGAGTHLLGHPAPAPGLSCFGWLAGLGSDGASAIRRLDAESQRFETCAFAFGADPAAPSGSDFPIRAGEGYLLDLRQNTSLMLGVCP